MVVPHISLSTITPRFDTSATYLHGNGAYSVVGNGPSRTSMCAGIIDVPFVPAGRGRLPKFRLSPTQARPDDEVHRVR